MPEPRETVVARTIDEHIVYHGAPNQRSACKCGHLFEARMPHAEHIAHVADAVLAALQLRQEHRRDADTRWVTPWVGVHE